MSLWPEKFEEFDEKTIDPRTILEQVASELEILSAGKAFAKVDEYAELASFESIANLTNIIAPEKQFREEGEKFYNKYSFEFYLGSRIEKNYKYRVFAVYYMQDFYPLKLRLDPDIYNDIKPKESFRQENFEENSIISVVSVEDFEFYLGEILKSRKIKFVIGKLMTLKKESSNEIEIKKEINSLNDIFIAYRTEERGIERLSYYEDIHFFDNNIWLTQNIISKFFNIDMQKINQKINKIFEDKELIFDKTVREFDCFIEKEERLFHFYNFPMLISLAFRIKNNKAVKLRQWVGSFINEQITQNWISNSKHIKELTDGDFLLQAAKFIKENTDE